MGVFQSGQMGQTVNLLSTTSVVRIHLRPPLKVILALNLIFDILKDKRYIQIIWKLKYFHYYAPVAQLVEQLTLNQRVQGSSPCRRT